MEFDTAIDVVIESSEVYGPSDDSFLMVKILEVEPGKRFLDMGCGAGLISLPAYAQLESAYVTKTIVILFLAAIISIVCLGLFALFVFVHKRWTWIFFISGYGLLLWYYAARVFWAFNLEPSEKAIRGYSSERFWMDWDLFWGIPNYMAVLILLLPWLRKLTDNPPRQPKVSTIWTSTIWLLLFPIGGLIITLGFVYLLAILIPHDPGLGRML